MEQGPARTVFETSRGDYTKAVLAAAFDPEAREAEQGGGGYVFRPSMLFVAADFRQGG